MAEVDIRQGSGGASVARAMLGRGPTRVLSGTWKIDPARVESAGSNRPVAASFVTTVALW